MVLYPLTRVDPLAFKDILVPACLDDSAFGMLIPVKNKTLEML